MKYFNQQIKRLPVNLKRLMGLLSAVSIFSISAECCRAQLPPLVTIIKPESNLRWMEFRAATNVPAGTFVDQYHTELGLGLLDDLVEEAQKVNVEGHDYYRYYQTYQSFPVEGGFYIVHADANGSCESANGRLIVGLDMTGIPSISEAQALQSAKDYVGADVYIWETQEELVQAEAELFEDEEFDHTDYANIPQGELMYARVDFQVGFAPSNYRLAYKFYIYAFEPLSQRYVYIDALNGSVIKEQVSSLGLNCHDGDVNTKHNGWQEVQTKHRSGKYRSIDECRGGGIELKYETRRVFGIFPAWRHFKDDNNNWANNTNSGTSEFWGAAMAHDYFADVATFERNSIDGKGTKLDVRIFTFDDGSPNYDVRNKRIRVPGTFNGGSGRDLPLDVMAHEFSHGVIDSETSLLLEGEHLALHEGIADIFGSMAEHYAILDRGLGAGHLADYQIGGQLPANFDNVKRDMSDPKSKNSPNTYEGMHWDFSLSDPHTNGNVIAYWFYLTIEGGSGNVDDNPQAPAYAIAGMGRHHAQQVLYRALSEYMGSSSDFQDVRSATIKAAVDRFGTCAEEVKMVADAWDAVGVHGMTPGIFVEACGSFTGEHLLQSSLRTITCPAPGLTTVNSGSKTVFKSFGEICLQSGFTAEVGSEFTAYIDECSPGYIPKQGASLPPQADTEFSSADGITGPERMLRCTPNPINSATEIEYRVEREGPVRILVSNLLGEQVAELIDIPLHRAGTFRLTFDASGLPAGIYWCSLHQADGTQSLRLMIAR